VKGDDHAPIDILLVEDDPGDVRLTREALQEGKLGNTLHVVQDGVQAMAFLQKLGPYSHAPTPDLILLDLNLPGKDGRQVLAEIKADPGLRRIPIVILTTSASEQDVLATYDLHANCFVVKPVGFAEFLAVVEAIEHFWLTITRLPPHDSPK